MGGKAKEEKGTAIRISGTGYDPGTIEGKASLKRLKHYKTSEDGKHCEIDTQKIREIITAYVDVGYRRETRTKKNGAAEEVVYAPISRPGLRLKLGIGRDTYDLWLKGFADGNTDCAANEELADAMREGDDAIAQYLVENNDSGSSTKSIRLLEAMGEFAALREQGYSPLAAGEWAKRAE